jgi:Flp pilus assembly protein TadG
MSGNGGQSKQCRGQSAIEVGLVLPVLVVTLMGMVEVAWWLRSYVIVGTAAREGMRYGSRGPHLGATTQEEILDAASDTADSVQESMEGLLDLDFGDGTSNATIMVTFVEIGSDGAYSILDAGSGGPPTYTRGDLSDTTGICTAQPCDADQFDLVATAQENLDFNNSSDFCPSGDCPGDLVVVEVFYMHAPLMFQVKFLPDEIPTNSRGMMRIVVKESD